MSSLLYYKYTLLKDAGKIKRASKRESMCATLFTAIKTIIRNYILN